MQKKPLGPAGPPRGSRILAGGYSEEAQRFVRTAAERFSAFNQASLPLIPYISAWQEGEDQLWYEFAGQRLIDLLACDPVDLAEVFRQSVLDRREYHCVSDPGRRVREEVLTGQELELCRPELRRAVRRAGRVEALYKLAVGHRDLWLKDQATVRFFPRDRLAVSLGCLTDVTKEMAQKDLLQRLGYFDELTRLPSTNLMQMLLDLSFGQVRKRLISDFVFLLLDIDHFAAVLREQGPEVAGQLLNAVAELLVVSKRKGDEVGRYGDGEFYALSLGGPAGGREFAQRLRRVVAENVFAVAGKTLRVTVSIGVVAASEIPRADIDHLVAEADRRLRQAKAQGGDRVL